MRRAIGAGVVGANIEDQMRPLGDAVAAVEAAVRAGEAEGVPFVLNARTDAYLLAGDRTRRRCSPTRSTRPGLHRRRGELRLRAGPVDDAEVGALVEVSASGR